MKKIHALLISLLMIGAGVFLTASPALARPTCGNGFICGYDNTSGSTLLFKKYWTDWALNRCYDFSTVAYDNRVSYFVNDSGHDLFVSTGYSCVGVGQIYANRYGPMSYPWDNSISSWYRAD